jgi:hypothetical protein
VQRADIDRFIGALSGQYAQGIFVTTAGYTRQAVHKASTAIPRIATVDGDQVVTLMLRHRLGIAQPAIAVSALDEAYFGQFEDLAAQERRVADPPEAYRVGNQAAAMALPAEDDLITLRALSHALRVDTSIVRRWIEQGRLQPDKLNLAAPGVFFRRDRIAAIRAELLGRARPESPDAWRQEFLDFAHSRNLSKSYKPVLLKALLEAVDRDGEAQINALVAAFRAFYLARRQAGLPVEFGPPDPSDTRATSDGDLRQLIVRNPLERFLIKGFLEYLPDQGVVRFAPQLWSELRFYELLDLRASADEQLRYYYVRTR